MPFWIAILLVAMVVSGCAALRPVPKTMAERLDVFPRTGLLVERPVTIRWNRFQVPFVEAENDRDLAFAMGMVHGHLRLAEIRVLKQLVQGRASEMVGPVARNIDHALKHHGYRPRGAGDGAAIAGRRAGADGVVRGGAEFLSVAADGPAAGIRAARAVARAVHGRGPGLDRAYGWGRYQLARLHGALAVARAAGFSANLGARSRRRRGAGDELPGVAASWARSRTSSSARRARVRTRMWWRRRRVRAAVR